MEYSGSVFWLIFFAILFFPVAIMLLFLNGKFQIDQKAYSIRYNGSNFWLIFWMVFMIPVAIILMALNGIMLVTDEQLEKLP